MTKICLILMAIWAGLKLYEKKLDRDIDETIKELSGIEQTERPYDHIWDMYFDEFEDYELTPNACKTCPNHPKNGGCGICHCTLGTPKIQ